MIKDTFIDLAGGAMVASGTYAIIKLALTGVLTVTNLIPLGLMIIIGIGMLWAKIKKVGSESWNIFTNLIGRNKKKNEKVD
jgi:hypothetical protein